MANIAFTTTYEAHTFDGRDLAEALSKIPLRVSKRMLREALAEAIGEPMRKRMAQLAPHEPGPPDIRDAIVISNARLRDEAGVYVGPARGFFYGYFQEFGTANHSAQPFVRPAFDSEGPRGLGPMGAAIWRELAGRGISRPMAIADGPLSGEV